MSYDMTNPGTLITTQKYNKVLQTKPNQKEKGWAMGDLRFITFLDEYLKACQNTQEAEFLVLEEATKGAGEIIFVFNKEQRETGKVFQAATKNLRAWLTPPAPASPKSIRLYIESLMVSSEVFAQPNSCNQEKAKEICSALSRKLAEYLELDTKKFNVQFEINPEYISGMVPAMATE